MKDLIQSCKILCYMNVGRKSYTCESALRSELGQ